MLNAEARRERLLPLLLAQAELRGGYREVIDRGSGAEPSGRPAPNHHNIQTKKNAADAASLLHHFHSGN